MIILNLLEQLKHEVLLKTNKAGCDPLRIFINQDGLYRTATEEYEPPVQSNLSDLCMHLINYAINKNN